jgi:hypothetical protein
MAWIHDDITWCIDNDCPLLECMRNPKNMMDHSGLHSMAAFRETDECPIYRMEQQAALEREDETR